MRVGQTSLVVFVSKVVARALGFVATIYFARLLGAEVLGIFALVIALVSWLKLGGKLGVGSAVKKRISEGKQQDEYFTAGLLLIATFAVGLSVIVLVFEEYVEAYVGAPVVGFVVAILLVTLIRSYILSVLEGQHLVHVAGSLVPVETGVRSVLQIALVFVGWQLTGMLVGYVLGSIIVATIALAFLTISIERPTLEHFRSLIEYARYSWLGSLESRSFNDVDVLVLGIFVSSGLVGVYYIAWGLAKFLLLFGRSIRTSMFPEISSQSANDEMSTVGTLVEDSLTYGGLITIPGLAGGILLGDRLLLIYGDEFVRGFSVLGILLFAILLYGYQKQLLNALNAIDRPDVAFRINAAFILLNAVLNVFLIWQFGILGAAVATATSAGFGFLLSYLALSKLVQFRFPLPEIGRQCVAALLMGGTVATGLWFHTAYGFVVYNVVLVVLLVSLGAAVYFSAYIVISPQFRTTISNNLPDDTPFLAG